jgi:hypothetical protein
MYAAGLVHVKYIIPVIGTGYIILCTIHTVCMYDVHTVHAMMHIIYEYNDTCYKMYHYNTIQFFFVKIHAVSMYVM